MYLIYYLHGKMSAKVLTKTGYFITLYYVLRFHSRILQAARTFTYTLLLLASLTSFIDQHSRHLLV